ncbi:MAG: VWA domain-containing protein [Phycisphaerae bacterium]|nr:VWA domain-containing protein [Phycisphaerae bacterium]
MLALSIPISFERPEWLWLMAAIPVITAISVRSLAGLDRWRRILAVVMRSLVIIALAIALAEIQYVKRNDHVAVMFVLDRSKSIPDDRREAAQNYVKELSAKAHPDDRIGVIGFDGQTGVDLINSRGGAAIFGFGTALEPDRTDIAGALRMAMASFPEGFSRRVVLVTDGNENLGSLNEEIEVAAANKVAVDVIPIEYQLRNEVLFDRIVVPPHANKDTKIPLRLLLKSREDTKVQLTLYDNDRKIELKDTVLPLVGGMQPNPFTIPIEVQGGGVHRFQAQVTPIMASDDTIPENNRATAFTFVVDQGKVLIVSLPQSIEGQVRRDTDDVLVEALGRERIEVEVANDVKDLDLLKLQEYAAVVLANTSAGEFTDDQHKALASYVRDFGGGLIMTGGDESFGAGGWIGKPLEEISPVSFEIKQKQVMPRGGLAIIMHSCEIPRGNYWGEQVALKSLETISSLDYFGVVCYSYRMNGYNWDVPLAPALDKPLIKKKITSMQIGDMPDFAQTMTMAVDGLMSKKDASQRHVIIISDGDPTPPSASTIDYMKKHQITCSTVGIGYGVHVQEANLRQIARDTGGRFYDVKDPTKLPQIFMKEAKVVRKPLIDDRVFSPRLVFDFAQITQGINDRDLPRLGGLVLTEPKPDCIMPIVRRSQDGNDPVLAHWNYEMGKMAVFTSGWWPKWGTDWSNWAKYGKFWAQLLRWAMRQEESADFDVMARIDGNKGHISIEALNKDATYLNFLRFSGRLTTPSMEAKTLAVTQTGPGRYEATFDVDEHGNYLINLTYRDDKGMHQIRTGVSMPYSPEFREMGTNLSLLNRVVERTGGRMLLMDPLRDKVFDRHLPPAISRQPVWRWIVTWLLLPLFLLDVATRRLASNLAMSIYVEVAVFVVFCAVLYTANAPRFGYVGALVLAEVIGWAIRYNYLVPTIQFFTASVTALARIGQRSTASLSQLKDVSGKVREGLDARVAEKREQRTIELEPTPVASAKTRYDVGDKAAAKPAADLSQTLGKAAAKAGEPGYTEPRRKPGTKDAGDLTSRLLRAKRRAKEDMDGRAKDKQ